MGGARSPVVGCALHFLEMAAVDNMARFPTHKNRISAAQSGLCTHHRPTGLHLYLPLRAELLGVWIFVRAPQGERHCELSIAWRGDR